MKMVIFWIVMAVAGVAWLEVAAPAAAGDFKGVAQAAIVVIASALLMIRLLSIKKKEK